MAESNKMRLSIITPERRLYDSMVEMVIMRTAMGDIGVMYGHTPLTTSLAPGVMRILDGDNELRAVVFGGFAEISAESINILSDSAEWPDEIDKNRALAAKERAERRLAEASTSVDANRAKLALMRALVRIDVSSNNSQTHV